MSDKVQSRQRGGSADRQQSTKSERRAAAKAAAIKAANAKRQRQAILGALAGIAVVAVLITTFFVVRANKKDDEKAAATPPSASASAPAATESSAAAPQLPADMDPRLATKPDITAGTAELTKLTVTTLIKGNGPAVVKGQSITVNYVGVTYAKGEEFDSSWKNSQPATFAIGVGGVIPGWDQGLVGVPVGSRVQLDIPSDLAYGDNPTNGAPGGALRFIVDILAAQ